MATAHRVVVIGGGFGGLQATRHLRHPAFSVTLIDRRNFHLFQPLLYQVATGALSPANIAAPLRALLKRQRNVQVLLAEARDIDLAQRIVHFDDGRVEYDSLVIATGVTHDYFGHDEWEPLAPGLKSIEDATEIRRRILLAFENAEKHPREAKDWLTFAVIGGGPTGVELAGALAEISRRTLRRNFRAIDPATARILLVEGRDRVLGSFTPDLSESARRDLERLGVEVRLKTTATSITDGQLGLQSSEGEVETITARTVVWAAGVRGSSIARALADGGGAELDRAGRVIVEPDCSLAQHPEVFVIGDLAHFERDGSMLPGVAQVALQQGKYVARVLRDRLRGRKPKPFRYLDLGSMATIGRAAAVAQRGWLRSSGPVAWLAWLFVHLMALVLFHNRLLVFIQWAWHYLSWNRYARLITNPTRRRRQSQTSGGTT